MNWFKENVSWIFSGIGVVLLTGFGYLIKRALNGGGESQSQEADRGSVAIQAGRETFK